MKISIETIVDAPLQRVWECWVTPADITQWNFASDEWCCPSAELTLEVGGKFNYRMESKDAVTGFDFNGKFTYIQPLHAITYRLADEREVLVKFIETENSTNVIETFETEDENSVELQKQGWLSILTNFKKHVESKISKEQIK